MQNAIATINTPRLTLRPQVLADFPVYEAFLASERSIGMGGPFDRRSAWGSFCHDLASWHFFGHGALMIELAETKLCIGQVSINHGPLFPEKELGWFLYEGYENKGYATEAASAFLDWAFNELKLPDLVSYVAPDNRRSSAIAKRLDGILDLTAAREDPQDIVYRYRPRAAS